MVLKHLHISGYLLALGVAAFSAVACGDGDGDGGSGSGDGDGDGGSGDGDGDGDGAGGVGGAGGDGDGDELALGVPGAEASYLAGFPQAIIAQGENLLIAGRIDTDFWVTRVHPDGSVDDSFASAGDLEIAFPESTFGTVVADFDVALGLHLAEDSIFVAGAIQGYLGPFETRWGLAKLDADGNLDETFAEEGLKVVDWTIGSRAYQVKSDTEGRLYLGGTIENASTDIALVRLASDGSVDDTFRLADSGAGAVLSDGNSEEGLCLLLNEDRVIAAGGPDFGVTAVDLDGRYDASFGDGGWSKPADGSVYALEELPDGKFYAVGTEAPNADSRVEALLLLRLLPTGELDETFAEGGIARITYDFGSYVWPALEEEIEWQDAFVRVNGLSVLPDESVLIYGDALGFLARYPVLIKVTAEGQIDSDFGQEGLVAFPLMIPLLAGAVPQAASRMVSDGTTAWFVDEFVFSEGNRGVLVTVDLADL